MRREKMFVWVSAVVLCAALVLLTGCHGHSEANVTIGGTVTDKTTGEPVAGARVADHLYAGKTDKACQEAWTDAEGKFALQTWYEEHTLVVSAPGYPPTLATFKTNVVGKESKAEMNFEITKKV